MNAQLLFDDLAGFYNGYNAVAERVEKSKLQYMHISTGLDFELETWVRNNYDVILTGNPGDGKTHLIQILEDKGLLTSAYVEKDASQNDTETLLSIWKQKKQENVPFLLAINHAPLRNLATNAQRYQGIEYLASIPMEIDNTVYYNEVPKSKLERTIVVDLSQRETSTYIIVKSIVDKLSNTIIASRCNDCPPRKCPMEYNAEALSNDTVLRNLTTVLSLITRRGTHTTMRDLIGLLTYILFSDKSCAKRWQSFKNDDGDIVTPTFEDYTYYNLIFKGRSHLFDAIRATFDPANYSDAESDSGLWKGTIHNGWLISEPLVTSPGTLEELRILKRRYYFEHHHDTKKLLQRMLPTMEYRFSELIEGKLDTPSEVENLVGMINTFYAPTRGSQNTDQHYYRLRLWNSHRYASGAAPGYFAMRSVPADNLTLYWPKANPAVAHAMEIRQDHVLLAFQGWEPGEPGLRVDWPMYQALTSAQSGTPIDVQPLYILRRLDLFLRSLGPESGGQRHIENIEWSNHKKRTLVRGRKTLAVPCH